MNKPVNYDWFSLDRDTLFTMMFLAHDRVVNQKLTVDQLHRKLTNQIKKFIPVKCKKVLDKTVEKSWVYVGGAYYSDLDEDGERAIEVNFNYNPKDKDLIINSKRFGRMCMTFADTVLHEIIHMRQHRRRNFKIIPDYPSTASRTRQRESQQYLGNRDEIDAYAFNSACELHERFSGKKTKIINYLNTSHSGAGKRTCSFVMYLKAFGHNHRHPIIKKYKKKIVSYLPQAEVGKPYRNSEWINY